MVSSNQISLFKVSVNSKNNSKTSNNQQKEKSYRGEMLLEPTIGTADTLCGDLVWIYVSVEHVVVCPEPMLKC
jgi:hypothetical protein